MEALVMHVAEDSIHEHLPYLRVKKTQRALDGLWLCSFIALHLCSEKPHASRTEHLAAAED